MERSISLGRIGGIEVGINWTWLIVFALVTFSLAVGVFPEENPGLSDQAYAAMALIASALFFASILLHELGHALQARREGAEIEGITLWLFGGVAQLKGMHRSPGVEFRIAIAGPLVTVAIATVLIGLGSVLELPTAVEGVVFWLGYINVLLLVFNMVPAPPLDGGRVLHAALWRLRDDFLSATRTAATVGVAFGYLLVGAGIAMIFVTASLGGIWLVLIGWFLSSAAEAEASQLAAHEALGDVRVSALMSEDVVTVPPGMSLANFADRIAADTRFTSYPVLENGSPVGLLSFRDLMRTSRELWAKRLVGDAMTPLERVPSMRADDSAADALDRLMRSEVRRALVVDRDGRLIGLLSIRDLARTIQVQTGEGGSIG